MAEPPSDIFRKEAWDAYYAMVEEPPPLLRGVSRWIPIAFAGLVAVAIASVVTLGTWRVPRYRSVEGVLLSLDEGGRRAVIRLPSPGDPAPSPGERVKLPRLGAGQVTGWRGADQTLGLELQAPAPASNRRAAVGDPLDVQIQQGELSLSSLLLGLD